MTWFEVLKSLTPSNMDDILDDLEDVMGFYKGGRYEYWTPEIDRLHNDLQDLLDIAGPTTKEVLAKYDSVISLFKSEDFVEGPLAFSQKRKPDWKGK